VLIALSRTFAVDPAEFDADDESRLIADLREASADLALGVPSPTLAELKLTATTTPAVARQFLALHRAYRGLDQRLKTLDEALGSGAATMPGTEGVGVTGLGASTGATRSAATRPEATLPYEEVRDFFHYRNNYVDELDQAAEQPAPSQGGDEPDPRVQLAMEKLAPQDRAIITLFYWQELSLQEIADSMDINLNAAKTRLYRARERFRQYFEQEPEI
jgi:RNA polymerase sigma factor (sigma-70 family)